jgi:hypothetical protein
MPSISYESTTASFTHCLALNKDYTEELLIAWKMFYKGQILYFLMGNCARKRTVYRKIYL